MKKGAGSDPFGSGDDNAAKHERPHEDWHLKLPLSLDHAEFLGVLFEELGGKQCSEPTHNPR